MKTPEQAVDDVALFLNTAMPRWDMTIVSPTGALQRGAGSCAARSMVACSYIQAAGFKPLFAFHKVHGTVMSRAGDLIVGHAVSLVEGSEGEAFTRLNLTGREKLSGGLFQWKSSQGTLL